MQFTVAMRCADDDDDDPFVRVQLFLRDHNDVEAVVNTIIPNAISC